MVEFGERRHQKSSPSRGRWAALRRGWVERLALRLARRPRSASTTRAGIPGLIKKGTNNTGRDDVAVSLSLAAGEASRQGCEAVDEFASVVSTRPMMRTAGAVPNAARRGRSKYTTRSARCGETSGAEKYLRAEVLTTLCSNCHNDEHRRLRPQDPDRLKMASVRSQAGRDRMKLSIDQDDHRKLFVRRSSFRAK